MSLDNSALGASSHSPTLGGDRSARHPRLIVAAELRLDAHGSVPILCLFLQVAEGLR